MKKFFTRLLLICLICGGTKTYATHLMGGNLYYTFVSFNAGNNTYTYNIELKIYRLCNPGSSQLPPNVDLGVYHHSTVNPNANKTQLSTWVVPLVSSRFITPPNPNPNCAFTSTDCVEEGVYQISITLPATTEGYHLMIDRCCRNNNISNLDNPMGTGQTYYAFIPPTSTHNSSATFATAPVPFICAGDTTSILNAAYDPDGDSLAYAFVTPFAGISGTGNPNPTPPVIYPWPIPAVNYATTYDVLHPFGPGDYAAIDATTGLTSYMSPNTGFYVVAVEIYEYRNGILIGITRRDLQIIVVACPLNNAPAFTVLPTTYTIDEGTNLCFPINFTDVNGDTIFISTAGPIFSGSPAATFTPTITGPGSSSGQFCWPTSCDQGRSSSYQFTATALDNGCPAKVTNVVFTINVEPTDISSITGPDSICSSSGTITPYSVIPVPTFTYQWSVTGGSQVSGGNTNSIGVTWSASSGTVSTYASNLNSCHSDTVELNVIASNPSAVAGPNVFLCSGDSSTLGAAPVAQQTYSWSPATGLNNPSISNPRVGLVNGGAAPVTIQYILTAALPGCTATDTVSVTVNPQPTASLAAFTSVCTDEPAFALTGGSPGGGSYSGTGVSGGMFNPAAAGPGTHAIQYLYSNAFGCSDSVSSSITVNALPAVNAGTYSALCINASPVSLIGSPSGGLFSGAGVSGSIFNPSTAGAGAHSIIYSYTDASGCANADTTSITVNDLPTVNAGTYSALCIDASPVSLNGSPVGGTFSGNGVTGTSFNPATAGAGTHTITYSYTDASGCSNSSTASITVNALPTVSAGSYAALCISASVVSLNGTPSGGTFSGTGVSGSSFDPATAGPGTHSIIYAYTDVNGCSNADTTSVTVYALPSVSAGTYSALCINAAAVSLNGTPSGGSFSGTGVSGSSFSPTTAGTGAHSITYSYTDANGCSNTSTTTITVFALPTVNAGSYSALCVDAAAIALSGTPSGGTFSGTGVSGTSFNPATAGAGTHTVTYSYTDANGCSNSSTASITVNALPTVNAGSYSALCIDASSISLNGSPSGGTFTGTGVSGSSFSPAAAGAGTHTITYSYTDANGCSNSSTASITVNALPSVTMNAITSICSNATAFALTAGSPSGGTYSGTGVSGGMFNPAVSGAGTFTITYTYTDGNGCTNSASSSITVFLQPVVTLASLGSICINEPAFALTGGSPSGGTYTGTGVSGGMFDPSAAGLGTHTLKYTFTGAGGCTDSATTTITVNTQPTVSVTVSAGISCRSNTIYVGYGPQSLTITATTSASGPIYSWYKDGVLISGATASTLDVTSAGSYTAIVTDAFGCVSSSSNPASISTIFIVDIRCGHDLKKVILCHVPPGNPSNPQTLCIAPSAVPAHLGNHPGDCLGPCPSPRLSALEISDNVIFSTYPNPFREKSMIEFTVFTSEHVVIELFDIQGKLKEVLFDGTAEHDVMYQSELNGEHLAPGVYLLKVASGSEVTYYKAVKTE